MNKLKQAVDDLFNPRLPIDEAADRHFSLDFRQRTNGTWDDRRAFIDRIAKCRAIVDRGTVTVLVPRRTALRGAPHRRSEQARREGILLEVIACVISSGGQAIGRTPPCASPCHAGRSSPGLALLFDPLPGATDVRA